MLITNTFAMIGKVNFALSEGGAFGSYGTAKSVTKLVKNLQSHRVDGLHFDNECRYGVAVQVSGAKLYWIQTPTLNFHNFTAIGPINNPKLVANWLNTFYAERKMTAFTTPADEGLVDRVGILNTGEMLLFEYWIPHSGMQSYLDAVRPLF